MSQLFSGKDNELKIAFYGAIWIRLIIFAVNPDDHVAKNRFRRLQYKIMKF